MAPTLKVSPSSKDLESILESKRDKRKYSLCAHNFVLKIALEFLRNLPLSPSEQCKMAFTNTIRKDDPCGYFEVIESNNANELHRSARLTHDLSVAYREINADGDVIFMHQSPLLRGSCDISVYMDIREGFSHPSCCIEVGLSTSYTVESKIAQVTAEANYLLKQMPAGMWTPVLSVIMIIPGEIHISMCFLSRDGDQQELDPKIARIKIAQCPLSAESIFALLQALVMFNEMVKRVIANRAQFSDSIMTPQPNSNVLVLGDTVYKVYDYRGSRLVSGRRSPSWYFTVSALHTPPLLDNLRYEVEDQHGLSIISYEKVSGNHYPSCVGDLLDILETIYIMAKADLVHGDIRLANMIFLPTVSSSSSAAVSTGRRGVLIDFDFSGRCGKDIYPDGFNVDIEDGKRHEDVKSKARGSCTLQHQHDIFGFVAVCRLFELQSDSCALECSGAPPPAKKTKVGSDVGQWESWLEALVAPNLSHDETWLSRIESSIGSVDFRSHTLRLRSDCWKSSSS